MKNKCGYLVIRRAEFCNKSCLKQFCGGHNVTVKKHKISPSPCIKCGVGTYRSIQICTYCTPGGQYSSDRYEAKIRKIAYLANQDYTIVRDNLVKCT